MEEETIYQGNNNPPTGVPDPNRQVPPIQDHPANNNAQQSVPQPQVQQHTVESQNTAPNSQPISSPPQPPIQDHEDGPPIKKILIIVIAIIIAIGLVLGLLSLIFSRDKSGDNSGQKELSYWGIDEDPDYMKSVIADFEKENPEIKINYEKQDPSNYREKLSTRIPNGNGPDIFTFHNTWFPQLEKELAPIPSSVITKESFATIYYPSAQKDLVQGGSIYGIPLETDTLALFVNPQILEAASSEDSTSYQVPATWQDFIKTTASLTKRDDQGRITIAGAGIGPYDNVEHAPDIISLLFAQNGVDFNDIDNSAKKIDDALTFYTNFALFENNVYDSTLDNTLKAFADGKLAMFFGYSTDYFKIKQLNPSLNFNIAPVPQLLNEEKVNMTSYWAEGVSSQSPNKDAAMLFMKYLTKPEVQEKLFTEQSAKNGFGHPYANKNLAKKLEGTPFSVFAQQSSSAVSSPFVSNTFDNGLNDKLNLVLQGIVNGILNGQGDVSAVEQLSAGKQQVMDEINGVVPEK